MVAPDDPWFVYSIKGSRVRFVPSGAKGWALVAGLAVIAGVAIVATIWLGRHGYELLALPMIVLIAVSPALIPIKVAKAKGRDITPPRRD